MCVGPGHNEAKLDKPLAKRVQDIELMSEKNPSMTIQSGSSTAPAASKPLYAKLAKRLVIAIAIIFLGLVPSLVLYLITKEPATTWATGAFIAGVTAVLVGGVEIAVYTVIVMSLVTPVAIVAGGTPVAGTALMVLMCLIVGRMSRFGLQRATLLVPVFMAWMIVSPPFWGSQHVVDRNDSTFLAWMMLTFFIGAILPVIVLPFALRKMKMPVPRTHPRSESVIYTLTITLLASGATFWVLNDSKQYAGAWLIATIMVLVQVGDVGTVNRTIQRVIGTLLGMLVVWVIVLQVHSLVVVYCVGIVFAVAAVTAKFSPHYWIYMSLITPAIVCFTAASSAQIANLGEQRAQDTLIGAALVLLASAITIGSANIQKRRGHAPTVETPVVMGEPLAQSST